MPKHQKYKPWFGLDGGDSFFNPFTTDPDDYRALIRSIKEEMAVHIHYGTWRLGDNWLLAETHRGLRAAKKGKLYKRRNWPGNRARKK